MAEVWAARMRGPSGDYHYFAIKLLASHLAERAEYREMFLGEARLSMQLSHPNIVRVFDAVAQRHDCYMVMELISGMTLSQLERSLARERQTLPLVVTAYIVGELLRALAYAHQVRTEHGSVIVHRDVSPQNVMVTSDGQVKLMDFGIARFASQETQGAFVKGKLQYMPPEQLRKETRKPTVDLYAVGAILHELLDGKRFRGRVEQAQLIDMVMHGEIPPLSNPIPTQLDIVRRGLLEPDEAARIQTARKALGMLCRWPEYREAATDLRALVQHHVELATSDELPEGSRVSNVPEGSFSGLQGLDYVHDSGHSDSQLSAAATEPTGSELTAEELVSLPSAAHSLVVAPRARRGFAWVFAGVGVAAALGGGALIYAVAQREGPSDEAVSAQPIDDRQPAKVADEGPPPSQLPSQPLNGAPQQPEPEAQPKPQPQPQAEAEPEPSPSAEAIAIDEAQAQPDASARVKVPVEFVANEFFFVYVKVGGRVLTLEPRGSVELLQGKHTVYLRQSPDDKWVRAGRITLEPGREYRVEMRKPAGLQLVKK